MQRPKQQNSSPRPSIRLRVKQQLAVLAARILGAVFVLAAVSLPAAAQNAGAYQLTNIISDGYVPATTVDPNFIDPWGISGNTDFWIDTAVTGYSYVNYASGTILFKTAIPAASGSGAGQPTGTVLNTTSGFFSQTARRRAFYSVASTA